MLMFLRHAVMIVALLIGTTTDLKKREVPDWPNFALIGSGILFGVLESIFAWSWNPFFAMSLGLLSGVIIGYAMFYAGQWGGGDAKMIMGLGALFGIDLFVGFSLFNLPLFVIFLLNTLLVGAIYGLFWLFFLALKKRKAFVKEFKIFTRQKKIIRFRIIVIVSTLFSWVLAFLIKDINFTLVFATIGILIFFLFYLWVIMKIIEKVAMLKNLSVDKLVEGDWINKDIWVKQSYDSFFSSMKKRSLLELKFILENDSLISFYEQVSWKNLLKKREKKLKKQYVLSDEVLLKKVFSYYVASCKSSQKKVLSLIDLKKVLSSTKNDILKFDKLLLKKSCPSLINFLKKSFYYSPEEYFITGPKELGVRTDQIVLLKKHGFKEVLVKEGVPFVPSFLIAYIITILLGNWFIFLV